MTQSYEEYLKHVAEHGETFSPQKKDLPEMKMKLGGPNGKWIYLKDEILLNYGCTEDNSIIYIEDNTDNKQFTQYLNTKEFKLYLFETSIYIDFDVNCYYILDDFDTFKQYEYCQKNKQLTIGLLNYDKSNIINKWTTNVNLL